MTTLLVNKVLGELMGDLSESELAKLVNVPKATINRLLSGRTPDPRIGTLAPIAQYFGITIEQLLGLKPLPNRLPFKETIKDNLLALPYVEFENIYQYQIGKYEPNQYHEISTPKSSILNEGYVTNVVVTSMLPKFQENSYLLVTAKLEPKHLDYVIFYDKKEGFVLFRKLICEGKEKYLCAIHPGFAAIKVDDDFLCLGIVIESRIFLK